MSTETNQKVLLIMVLKPKQIEWKQHFQHYDRKGNKRKIMKNKMEKIEGQNWKLKNKEKDFYYGKQK